MLGLVLGAFAAELSWDAVPEGFSRLDHGPWVTTYKALLGEGPVRGRWRNRGGAYRAWRFRDRQIEHVDLREGGVVVQTHRFDASGLPESTVHWSEERVELFFEPSLNVSIAGWTELVLGERTFLAPPELTEVEPGQWAGGGIVIATQSGADPFTPAFGEQVADRCGCEIQAVRTVWVEGLATAHYRLARHGPRPQTADLFVWPSDEGNRVFSAAGSDLRALLPLRAMMATAREVK